MLWDQKESVKKDLSRKQSLGTFKACPTSSSFEAKRVVGWQPRKTEAALAAKKAYEKANGVAKTNSGQLQICTE